MFPKLIVKALMALDELKRDEKGAIFIEYALVTGLIAVAVGASLTLYKAEIDALYGKLSADVTALLP